MSGGTSTRTSRPRRERSAQESLGAIVLGFELVIVLLGALVIFGLHSLPPVQALGGGAALIVLMIVAIALLKYRVGYWLGWFVQLVVVASGLLVGMLFIVGAIFAVIWAYAMIAGARLDRRNATLRAEMTGSRGERGASESGNASESGTTGPIGTSDTTGKENE